MAFENETDKDWEALKSSENFSDEDSYLFGYNYFLRRVFFVNCVASLRKVRHAQEKLEE